MKILIFRGQGSENIDSTDLLIYWFTDLSIQNLAQIHTKSIQNDIKNQPKIYPKSIEKSSQIASQIHQKSHPNRSFWRLGLGIRFFLDFGCLLGASWPRLGASWRRLGVSWRRLGGVLGASWGVLGRLGDVLEAS